MVGRRIGFATHSCNKSGYQCRHGHWGAIREILQCPSFMCANTLGTKHIGGTHMQTFVPMLLIRYLLHALADVVPSCKIDPFSCSERRQIDLALASPRFEKSYPEKNRSESILLVGSKFCSIGPVKHSSALNPHMRCFQLYVDIYCQLPKFPSFVTHLS